MITSAWTFLSASGFNVMNIRPLFTVELPAPAPMNEPSVATPGSASTMRAICCCNFSIAENEMSCDASVAPMIKPVSCCGKNPFGTTM